MKGNLISVHPSSEVNSGNSDSFLPQVEEATSGSIASVNGDGFLDSLTVEIGDEVIVPLSPSPFNFFNMADSDHSYFSVSRFLENAPQLRFSDCHLSGEPALLELPDLFDFNSVCQPFDGGSGSTSEQRSGNEHLVGSSTIADPILTPGETSTRTSKHEETAGKKETDEDSEECSSTEEESAASKASSVACKKSSHPKKLSSHHVGPLPQTFIEDPGERRARFCFGIRTIVKKINHLAQRTECVAQFSAIFEDHVFTLENVENLIRYSERNKARKDVGCSKSSLSGPFLSVDPDGDHLYAATMLTQTEKSGVTDHQYNEVSTSQTLGMKSYTKKKSFLRVKYQRERFLKSTVATIFSKLQRLRNRTGAKIDLVLEYEGIEISKRNYNCLDTLLLGNKKRILEKETTDHVFDTVAKPNSHSVPAVHGGLDQLISDTPRSTECLEPSSNQQKCTAPFESDHDYDIHTNRTEKTVDVVVASPKPMDSGAFYSALMSESVLEAEESHTGVIEETMYVEDVDNVIPNSSSSNDASLTCSFCGQIENINCRIGTQDHPAWIRCAHPLCQYLVHPWCIGFVVVSAQQIRYLPPYYCPSHRGL